MKKIRKLIALNLVLIMVMSLLPISTMAVRLYLDDWEDYTIDSPDDTHSFEFKPEETGLYEFGVTTRAGTGFNLEVYADGAKVPTLKGANTKVTVELEENVTYQIKHPSERIWMEKNAPKKKYPVNYEMVVEKQECPTLFLDKETPGVIKRIYDTRSDWGSSSHNGTYYRFVPDVTGEYRITSNYGTQTLIDVNDMDDSYKMAGSGTTPDSFLMKKGHRYLIEVTRGSSKGPSEGDTVLVKASFVKEMEDVTPTGPAILPGEKAITRAEFCQLIVDTMGYTYDENMYFSFDDVSKDSMYYKAMVICYNKHIMSGTSGAKFSPDNVISRGMAATIIHRVCGSPTVNKTYSLYDVGSSAWYYDSVGFAMTKEIMSAYAMHFYPNEPVYKSQIDFDKWKKEAGVGERPVVPDEPQKPEEPVQPDEPQTPQDPTQPEEDITAGFRLGRDNNHFVHYNGSSKKDGFSGIKRYELPSKMYWRLASYMSPAELLKMTLYMSMIEWGGSCFGVSSTMLLAHMNELDLSDLENGVEYYYDMSRPCDNDEFLNYIQYYQLGQNAVDLAGGDGGEIPRVLEKMLRALDEEPVIFCFGWGSGGHAIIALDYTAKQSGDYEVCLYDLNNCDGENAEYTTLTISADFENYSFNSCGMQLDENNLKYVGFATVDSLMGIDPEENNKKAVDETGECVQFWFFASQDEFTMEDAKGKTLKYEDGEFSGTMKIKDLDLTCTGTVGEAIWIVTVPESDEFTLTDCSGDVMMGLFTDDGCVVLETEEVKEVKFSPNEKIEIEADKKEYDMTAWMSKDMVDDEEVQIFQIEAEMQGDAVLEIDDGQVTVEADKVDNGSLILIDGMDEEKLKDLDSADDMITVSVDNKKQDKDDKDDKDVELPFADVAEEAWFYDAVAYVYDEGLMNGTTEETFSPDMTITRGMIVTILYRLEGEPTANATVFTDVQGGDYYAEAVAWAAENGIVTGYGNGIFAPNAPITREQLAAILHRYADYISRATADRNDLSEFADVGTVSPYALDSVQWAVGVGLINGVGADMLQPGGTATRAQAATILMRFCREIIN